MICIYVFIFIILKTLICEKTSQHTLYQSKQEHNNNNFKPILFGWNLKMCFSVAKFANIVVNQIFKEIHKQINKKRHKHDSCAGIF